MKNTRVIHLKKIDKAKNWSLPNSNAVIVLSDGTIYKGIGCGAYGTSAGEICFNTSITGYQEILTDPSYSNQIITFTFPHIGNVGINIEDIETANPDKKFKASGAILHAAITTPSNYRSEKNLDEWLKSAGIIGISGIDTRAITKKIREEGMLNGVISHNQDCLFDFEKLKKIAKDWGGIEGKDLAIDATSNVSYTWNEKLWKWRTGYNSNKQIVHKIAVIDYGVKSNILRELSNLNCEVVTFPANSNIDNIVNYNPDGIILSNGPGDPSETSKYSINLIKNIIEKDIPLLGICLGHQLLALALGARTKKMAYGHHGANHPVIDCTTGKVEITSMNHGFTVDNNSLPNNVIETHKSLFDDTNCGIAIKNKPIFSVQFHPEASPGPQDSHYLFEKFINNIIKKKQKK
ncbi:glutamine-hydrolyzing carbamoyl-phosphate synthase small subunit [Hyphomicrobiales bacterium]|jgi:carbamoyl-phosphate synthase small subunit|nr:glutamine-hydrolyzing carbamoyl-phosphate synthase small subunit [Rhodobiaceae bacterium]MBT5641179.1 glutamine-hydrolyzing carbamoyl-phosphate synthase small subunit [Rhodobiaceae bacterium]MBT6223424.1 glutamine-hydrolyzing carbamoyl-phosphate synthase small subunit [Rhodobiaceae bacterium]MDB4831940.1 glutamine-hydrolyzing carbamoyl-phosphate synthase small subunit [Hyphomicrobiales bacterium]MDC0139230.1 glutamine-hydrolyzing carbamoyl-phosphate synthase small subunit [Hyphomicrobiales b